MSERKRSLTEMQQKFLDALVDTGDFRTAMDIAGYSKTHPISSMVASLKEEITERAEHLLAYSSIKAATAMSDVLDNPTAIGTKERMAAAREILDRVGVVKRDKVDVNVQTPNGLFILPPKKTEEQSDDQADLFVDYYA